MPGCELRPTGVPRIQRYGNFSNLETLCCGNHHHVSMPIGTHWEAIHDLAPIRLDAIEVLDLHIEQQPAEAVVDPGDERLLVLPFLESRDHVRFVGEDRVDEARDVFGFELKVGGVEDEDAAACIEISRAQGVGDAAPTSMSRDSQE